MNKAVFLDNSAITNIGRLVEYLPLLKNAGFALITTSSNDSPKFYSGLIDKIYVCTHFLEECLCRRPKPGLIFQAAHDLEIDLKESWVLGDTLDEMEAGNRAGCHTILVANGHETQWQVNLLRQPEYISPDFESAAGTVVLKNIYQIVQSQNN